MKDDPILPPLSPPAGICRPESDENWRLEAERRGYLYYFFDQSLVSPSFGSLQATDILSNPSDEGKLDSLAHGITGGKSDKAKQSNIVWRDKAKRIKLLKKETSLPCHFPGWDYCCQLKDQAKLLILCYNTIVQNYQGNAGALLILPFACKVHFASVRSALPGVLWVTGRKLAVLATPHHISVLLVSLEMAKIQSMDSSRGQS